MSGFGNKPRIVRGAFVEYGLSLPPLFVVFQFNPDQLTRTHTLSFAPPNAGTSCPGGKGNTVEKPATLRAYHKETDLSDIQEGQQVTVQEENIRFDIRLDATDDLNDGSIIAKTMGIGPRLSTLEAMVYPKDESLIGAALGSLLGSAGGFSFTKKENPPMVLFIWGIKRVLPVNINSMTITETQFNTMLDPVRATVAVDLTVVEGKNLIYKYTKAAREVMSVVNLANIADIANIAIPG